MKENLTVYLCDLVHDYQKSDWNQTFRAFTVPLNIGYVGAYLKENMPDVDLKLFKYPSRLEEALESKIPDVIAFSNYCWNEELTLHFTRIIKELSPQTLVVSGGPNVDYTTSHLEEYLKENPSIDFYVTGEGEVPFTNLVKAFCEVADIGELKKQTVYNVACYDGIYSCPTDPNPSSKELILPSPYLSGLLDEFIQDEYLYPLFETSRGCPFSCTFCAWGLATRQRVKHFPLEQIFAEFEYVIEHGRFHKVWNFADANFGILKRDIKIAERMRDLQSRSKVQYFAINGSKNTTERNMQIADILGDSAGTLVAFQSLDPQVLKNIKRSNMKEQGFADLINHLKGKGLPVMTQLIRGLPGQTYHGNLETLGKCFDYDIRYLEIYQIQVLNGTELTSEESRKEYGLKTKFNPAKYSYGKYFGQWVCETEETVSSSNSMTEAELLKLRLIHFFVWFGWSLDALRPVLLVGKACNINPIEQIVALVDNATAVSSCFKVLVDSYMKEASEEYFDSKQDMKDYFFEQEDPIDALDNYTKLQLKTACNILSNKLMLTQIVDFLVKNIKQKTLLYVNYCDLEEMKEFSLNRLCLDYDDIEEDMVMPLSPKMHKFLTNVKLIKGDTNETNLLSNEYSLRFYLEEESKEVLRPYLESGDGGSFSKVVATSQNFVKKFFRTTVLLDATSQSEHSVSYRESNYV